MAKKTKEDLQAKYMTHGHWHGTIRNFLKRTRGNYLEIGVYWGRFLSELAIEFPRKRFNGIDPFIADGCTGEDRGTILEGVEVICRENISGLKNIKLFKRTTEDFLKKENLDILENITCLLIDGSHHYDDIVFDIELFRRIPHNKNKLVVFDDLHISDVGQAVEEFKREFKKRIKKEPVPGEFFIDGYYR